VAGPAGAVHAERQVRHASPFDQDAQEARDHRQYPDKTGICQLNLLHTTAALTTADLDPGTDLDMLDAFEIMVPKLDYRHEHNPEHVPDHILSAMIGTSVSLAVEAGLLLLGTWQRVVLIELDGPRERELVMALAETVV
jgi:secondary thiamine-phosphate synthase enzyme